MAKIKNATDKSFASLVNELGAFFNLPHISQEREQEDPNIEQLREPGQPIIVNDLRYAQEAVLRSVANALFYQLKSSQNYHERAVTIGRNMLNSTRPGPNMEDRFHEQRERILRAQAQVEVVRSAFRDSVRAYEHFTDKNWAEPNYTPRVQAQSNAAADLAKLVGGDGAGIGDDLAFTSSDPRQRVA